MANKTKLIDMAKNCAIVLLLFSAVFLLYKATFNEQDTFLKGLDSFFGGNSEAGTERLPAGESFALVSDPVFILVTAEDSSHYAVKYDNETKRKLITQFLAYLGEALGSSGEPEELTSEQWQKVLSGSGVFFDYLYSQPLSVIASSLGYEINSGASQKTARRFFLGNSNGNLVLYFISEGDGKIYSCDTVSSFSSLKPKIAECPIGNAKFAFELGDEYAKLDPYFIFSNESGSLRAVTVSNPIREGIDSAALLGYFGMNGKTVSKYTETDGSEVYVDGEKSLRIESSGKVVFSATGSSGLLISGNPEELSIADTVSACGEIVRNSIGQTAGEGVTGLVDVSSVFSPSSCTVSFGYFVNGIPVTLPGGVSAAKFHISGGAITRAELYFRSYALSGGVINALPEKQATVIAQSHGGEPVLTYEDKIGSVTCTWIYS